MVWLIRAVLMAGLLLTGACSMQAALDRMTSPEDRAFARGFVDSVRRGETAKLEPQFEPGLWAKSEADLAAARGQFPSGEGETRLVSYRASTNVTNGSRTTSKDYVLVTAASGRWTRTNISTFAQNGPARIVAWNVEGMDRPPPELEMFDAVERALPWVQAVLLILVVAMIGLVWWLVRRSRRRAGR